MAWLIIFMMASWSGTSDRENIVSDAGTFMIQSSGRVSSTARTWDSKQPILIMAATCASKSSSPGSLSVHHVAADDAYRKFMRMVNMFEKVEGIEVEEGSIYQTNSIDVWAREKQGNRT